MHSLICLGIATCALSWRHSGLTPTQETLRTGIARLKEGVTLMEKGISWLGTASMWLLLAAAVWFRTTSLEAIPEVHGDEAWYGIQVGHLLRGEPFATKTFSGSPLNPFFSGLMVPLHLAIRPTGWILRTPAVVSGILAVVATFVVGSKVLDRSTAMIAAALLAALPAAIVYSRTAFDCSQLPLFGIVIFGFAFRARPIGLLASLLLSLLVHPTGVFLLPAALAVFIVQAARKSDGDRWLPGRAILITSVAAVVIGIGLSFIALRRPYVKEYFVRQYWPQDWPGFGSGFGRFLLGLGMTPHEPHLREGWLPPPPVARLSLQVGLFWVAVLVALLFGVRRLWRDRAWDRLALVAGTVASVAGFHVVAGSRVFEVSDRYGVVLILPVVLSFACLVEAILADPLDDERRSDRRYQLLTLTAVGWLLLWCAKMNWFDPQLVGSDESFWTFRSETRNSHKQALSIVRRDLRQGLARPGPATIIAQPYWTAWPLQYYTLGQSDLAITPYFPTDPGEDRELLRRRLVTQMEAEAFAVSYPGGEVEQDVLADFPAKRLRRWDLARKGRRWLVVYRLMRPGENQTGALSSPGGPGRIDAGQWPNPTLTTVRKTPMFLTRRLRGVKPGVWCFGLAHCVRGRTPNSHAPVQGIPSREFSAMNGAASLDKPRVQSMIVDLFHSLYYDSPHTWRRNTFLGFPVAQSPIDLHLYQELVARQRPAFILQTGVMHGGSVLYFACLLDLIGAGSSALVVGIDNAPTPRSRSLRHPRIRLIEGSSTDPRTVAAARALVPLADGMVVLDSDHHEEHVLEELRLYREFVAPGQ